MQEQFRQRLLAQGPHPSLGAHADTYGRLIGSHRGEITSYLRPGTPRRTSIEVHFAWALDGRAIQDLWITPALPDRSQPSATGLDWYGTTVRVFDPQAEVWRATWIDPVSKFNLQLEGRRVGDDVVQIGTRGGWPIRWTFSDITAESFTWRGHILERDGVSWRLEIEIHLRRETAQ